MDKLKIRIKEMRDSGMRWHQIQTETGLSAYRIQLLVNDLGKPTPQEIEKIDALAN